MSRGAGVAERKLRMLIVGAFPPEGTREHGGVLTSCRVLMASSLPQRMELVLLNSFSPTVPPPPYLRRLLPATRRIILMVKHCLRSNLDVMLLFASPGPSFIEKSLMAAIARLFGIKTMMFPRGAALVDHYRASTVRAALLRLCFRIPTLMLCQGNAYQEFFAHEVGLGRVRCPIIHNWTATVQLLNIGASRVYSHELPLDILFLGWVDREKGIFELLDCVRQLVEAADVPSFKMVIAGDGSAMAEARQRLVDPLLGRVVELLGWIDSDVKVEKLRRAHLLVLPSYMEGMPNAIIEALAAGLPVVATDVGAVGDMVVDGVNGFLIPARDTDRLVQALRDLLIDGPLRERMGRAGWHIAKERFSAERAADQIVALADRVCGRDVSLGTAA